MGTDLSVVALNVARILGGVRLGRATTTGSTTTLTDIDFTNPAEHYKGGTIWFVSGDNDGLSRRISNYVDNQFEFDAVDNAVATDDVYMASDSKYTQSMLIAGINGALREVKIIQNDITLETVASQESYALPAGVKNVKRVEIATATSDPYGYAINRDWYVADGRLYFRTGKTPGTTGYIIRIWYMTEHDSVFTDASEINDEINLDWLQWASVAYILRDIVSIQENDDAIDLELFNEALQKANALYAVRDTIEYSTMSRPPFLP